ncbi:MAG: DUF721 domain-containing protein [Bacteroidaceae bacterium]|nr:DUF721 domain-containing protein [Bacteroidaceae bacterium]
MFRRRETHIQKPLMELLRQAGLETPLQQRRLVAAWPVVAGDFIAKQTGAVFIKNQTLMVQLFSPALRQELSFHGEVLTQKLNSQVGAQVITGIRFY